MLRWAWLDPEFSPVGRSQEFEASGGFDMLLLTGNGGDSMSRKEGGLWELRVAPSQHPARKWDLRPMAARY